MEGKRERGKPSIIMLDDTKADETYEKINCWMDRECWKTRFQENLLSRRTPMMIMYKKYN